VAIIVITIIPQLHDCNSIYSQNDDNLKMLIKYFFCQDNPSSTTADGEWRTRG